ncbi:MAG: aminodeoxychorismate/anthranilate synthase component II [Propionibacteriaceae bacterium]|jgi:anthranilate synthase component 2|nr:aminodeoxychorismate/anthranilate synthase component II [Propionibacteriaceae bacterium]
MILLIDNYDSFSYNLYQLIGSLLSRQLDPADQPPADQLIRVVRNDQATVPELLALDPSHIVVSPGPGRPSQAGVCLEAIAAWAGRRPILGVCLGHQAICQAFGAEISYARQLVHGQAWPVQLDLGCPLFAGLPATIEAARYHSLAAQDQPWPADLRPIARSADGEIMAVAHRHWPVFGIQFHPESILTPAGPAIMANFLGLPAPQPPVRQGRP